MLCFPAPTSFASVWLFLNLPPTRNSDLPCLPYLYLIGHLASATCPALPCHVQAHSGSLCLAMHYPAMPWPGPPWPCLALPCHAMPYHAMPCHDLARPGLPWLSLTRPALLCPALPPRHAAPYAALSCTAFLAARHFRCVRSALHCLAICPTSHLACATADLSCRYPCPISRH